MNYFDNENRILEWFRNSWEQFVLLPPNNQECMNLYMSLIDEKLFSEWIISCGKSDPPPDYHNPSMKMMMDVMRIDDHGHFDERGKFTNPVNQRESKIYKELKESGFLNQFPNLQSVFINAVTELPELEDHNYNFYFDNFKRTVEAHIRKIPLYKENHPNYKVVFFVFDESSGYVILGDEAKEEIQEGEYFWAYPYLHFLDRRFVEVFDGSDIDYLIWFSPFKSVISNMPEAPSVCIYDVKNINILEYNDYLENLIISTEK